MPRAHGSRAGDSGTDLLEPAWQMRWRVPELALMLSDRVVAEARRAGDSALRTRAEALALFASNRLGRSVAATDRALAAVCDAERSAGVGTASDTRVELACCARRAGSHDVAVRVLQPVLEQERVRPELRAHALVELAASLPAHRRAAESVAALDEAERLYTAEAELGGDTTRLLRARVDAARAAHHRRHAELSAAAGAAESGLALLDRLGDATTDSGEVRGTLVLEQVHALLDMGRHGAALGVAEPFLAQPLRAASAAPVGWLRLALATRMRMPAGEYRAAVGLLTEGLSGAERHGLVDLQAEINNTLSHLHEGAENLTEAVRCLRAAYAADRSWRASVHAARLRLLEVFPADPATASVPVVPAQQSQQGTQHRADPFQGATGEDVRYAARRLMESLTSRNAGAERSGGRANEAVPAPTRRRAEGRGAVAAEHEGSSGEYAAPGRRHRAEREPFATEQPLTPVAGEAVDHPREAPDEDPRPWPRGRPEDAAGDSAGSGSFDPSGESEVVPGAHDPLAGPVPASPDVTAIMPVIPGMPETPDAVSVQDSGPRRTSGPGTGGTSADVVGAGPDVLGVDDAPAFTDESAGVGADPADDGPVLDGTGVFGGRPLGDDVVDREASHDAGPDDGPWTGEEVPASDVAEDGVSEDRASGERPSRRAKGRSLAEIRAALSASGGPATTGAVPSPRSEPAASAAGERRARHADPQDAEREQDDAPRSGRESAAEFLARHGWLDDHALVSGENAPDPAGGEPADDAPPGSAVHEETVAGGRDVGDADLNTGGGELADLDSTGDGAGGPVLADSAPGGDVGLADLLAEALVAYRSGQEVSRHSDDGESRPTARHAEFGTRRTEGRRSRARSEHASASTEDVGGPAPRARHRHAAESAADSPHVWTPPVY